MPLIMTHTCQKYDHKSHRNKIFHSLPSLGGKCQNRFKKMGIRRNKTTDDKAFSGELLTLMKTKEKMWTRLLILQNKLSVCLFFDSWSFFIIR